jgi:hypothetical protein
MVIKTAKASARRLFFEQCETFGAMTADRRTRSAGLFGRFDRFMVKEAQQVATIVLQPDPIQQSLVVRARRMRIRR